MLDEAPPKAAEIYVMGVVPDIDYTAVSGAVATLARSGIEFSSSRPRY